MKKFKPVFLIAFLSFLVAYMNTTAQKPQIPKFGKDLIGQLNMTTCEIDSSANAVILFDDGESNIKFNKDKGNFYVEINRHARIKILDKEGLKWADFSIPLYKSKSSVERLSKFKGVTYNMSNGKIESVKLSRKSLFSEEINDGLTLAKFTMPQVKEGSVIEFSYTVISEFIYTLQHWEFQTEIPTLISNYSVLIPEYFHYNHRLSGYEKINIEKEAGRETITFKEITEGNPASGQARQANSYDVQYNTNRHHFYGYNIPKLKNEPYIDNLKNYQSRIDFELQFTRFPNQVVKQYALNWNSSTNDLLENENFGKEIDGVRFLTEDIQTVVNNITDPHEKMLAVFSHIQGKIKWNDRYRLKTEKSIRKAYNDGYGNSAEVNLCLVAALKVAGFDAFPIALSTRSTGLIHQWEVSISKLNHVIAGVVIGKETITLDATKTFSAPNILPLECLNGNARIIDRNKSNWIDLNPSTTSKNNLLARMSISENGEVFGLVSQDLYDHSALSLHNSLLGDDDFSKYQETLTKRYNNGIIDSINVNQSILPSPVIKVKYYASIPESVIPAGDLMYLTPGVGILLNSNPFVSPIRKLPINFHYPFAENQTFAYKIPEGYTIHEIPEKASFKMLNGKGEYNYSIFTNNEEVNIVVNLSINQTLFIPSEYDEIRAFFDKLVAKNAEKIIFKKI